MSTVKLKYDNNTKCMSLITPWLDIYLNKKETQVIIDEFSNATEKEVNSESELPIRCIEITPKLKDLAQKQNCVNDIYINTSLNTMETIKSLNCFRDFKLSIVEDSKESYLSWRLCYNNYIFVRLETNLKYLCISHYKQGKSEDNFRIKLSDVLTEVDSDSKKTGIVNYNVTRFIEDTLTKIRNNKNNY